MKLRIWGVAALAACLVGLGAQSLSARSQEQVGAPTPEGARPMADAMGPQGEAGAMDHGQMDQGQMDGMEQSEFGQMNSCLNDRCGTCDYGGNGGGTGGLIGAMTGGRRVQFVGGAQYIYAQATFSDATAFLEQNIVTGDSIIHQVDFGYNSSYAVYGGFYLPDCG